MFPDTVLRITILRMHRTSDVTVFIIEMKKKTQHRTHIQGHAPAFNGDMYDVGRAEMLGILANCSLLGRVLLPTPQKNLSFLVFNLVLECPFF